MSLEDAIGRVSKRQRVDNEENADHTPEYNPDTLYCVMRVLESLNILDRVSVLDLTETCKEVFRIFSSYVSKTYTFRCLPPYQFTRHQPEKLVLESWGASPHTLPPSTNSLQCTGLPLTEISDEPYSFHCLLSTFRQLLHSPPQLTHLNIIGTVHSYPKAPFSLPGTLTSLSFTAGHMFMRFPVIFPPSLREVEVKLSMTWGQVRESTEWHKTIGSLFSSIPLTKLTIGKEFMKPIPLGPLPPTLQSLSLKRLFEWSSLSSTLQHLPNLSSLSIKFGMGDALCTTQYNSMLTFFPPTLTTLDLSIIILTKTTPLLPPNLTSLTIKEHLSLLKLGEFNLHSWVSDGLAKCKNISFLEMDIIELQSLPVIPPNLTVLCIHTKQLELELSTLPRSILKLTIKSQFDNPLINLPLNLTSLTLDTETYSHPLDSLPPHLQHLTLSFFTLIHPLDSLPPHLLSLSLSVVTYPRQQINSLPTSLSHLSVLIPIQHKLFARKRESSLFAELPANLQVVDLQMPSAYMPSIGILPTGLRKLILKSRGYAKFGPGTLYSELSNLPSTITHFELHCKEAEFANISPFSLPPSITTLSLLIKKPKAASLPSPSRIIPSPPPPFPVKAWPPHLKTLQLACPEVPSRQLARITHVNLSPQPSPPLPPISSLTRRLPSFSPPFPPSLIHLEFISKK